MKEIALILGIMMVIMLCSITISSSFNIQENVPSQLNSSWANATVQVRQARQVVEDNIRNIEQGNLIDKIAGAFGIAFGGIYYIIVCLWTVFINIPVAMFEFMGYVGNAFGINPILMDTIIMILVIFTTLKMIEFLTGRVFT